MSQTLVTIQPVLAQQATPTPPEENVESGAGSGSLIWMILALLFLASSVGLVVYGKTLTDKHGKETKLDQYKIRDLKKKLKLALTTIKKMETNPDLVHSRDFNLDYLRMRMEERMFHGAIVNQMKIKVKQIITVALRPSTSDVATVGIATGGRQVDEIFDIHYETDDGQGNRAKGVLFRVHVKLTKLPTQSSSSTVEQIITCLETFLQPEEGDDNWQPSVQGRVAVLEWDQKAKPTPLLVLRQSEEGGNVSFRTQTARPPRPSRSAESKKARQQKLRKQRLAAQKQQQVGQQQKRRRSSSSSDSRASSKRSKSKTRTSSSSTDSTQRKRRPPSS